MEKTLRETLPDSLGCREEAESLKKPKQTETMGQNTGEERTVEEENLGDLQRFFFK